MRSRCWSSLALLAVVAGCGGGAKAGPYDYDSTAPLAFRDAGVVNHDYPVKIHDVSYAGDGHRVNAYLLVPPHDTGRHPAVVYLHGSGGSRLDLVTFAAKLSLLGAVTMALDVPQSDEYRPMVVDVRRSLDLLAARSDVDPKRIGVVGYSLGGAAGRDRRRRRFPAEGGRHHRRPGDARGQGRDRAMRRPISSSRRASNDSVVPAAQLEALIDAAPEAHRRVKWYPTDHTMSIDAFDEQDAWQARELGFAR